MVKSLSFKPGAYSGVIKLKKLLGRELQRAGVSDYRLGLIHATLEDVFVMHAGRSGE